MNSAQSSASNDAIRAMCRALGPTLPSKALSCIAAYMHSDSDGKQNTSLVMSEDVVKTVMRVSKRYLACKHARTALLVKHYMQMQGAKQSEAVQIVEAYLSLCRRVYLAARETYVAACQEQLKSFQQSAEGVQLYMQDITVKSIEFETALDQWLSSSPNQQHLSPPIFKVYSWQPGLLAFAEAYIRDTAPTTHASIGVGADEGDTGRSAYQAVFGDAYSDDDDDDGAVNSTMHSISVGTDSRDNDPNWKNDITNSTVDHSVSAVGKNMEATTHRTTSINFSALVPQSERKRVEMSAYTSSTTLTDSGERNSVTTQSDVTSPLETITTEPAVNAEMNSSRNNKRRNERRRIIQNAAHIPNDKTEEQLLDGIAAQMVALRRLQRSGREEMNAHIAELEEENQKNAQAVDVLQKKLKAKDQYIIDREEKLLDQLHARVQGIQKLANANATLSQENVALTRELRVAHATAEENTDKMMSLEHKIEVLSREKRMLESQLEDTKIVVNSLKARLS